MTTGFLHPECCFLRYSVTILSSEMLLSCWDDLARLMEGLIKAAPLSAAVSCFCLTVLLACGTCNIDNTLKLFPDKKT